MALQRPPCRGRWRREGDVERTVTLAPEALQYCCLCDLQNRAVERERGHPSYGRKCLLRNLGVVLKGTRIEILKMEGRHYHVPSTHCCCLSDRVRLLVTTQVR